MADKPEMVRLTPEQIRVRRQRSIAMALVLAALVVLFYIVSFVKGPGIMNQGF